LTNLCDSAISQSQHVFICAANASEALVEEQQQLAADLVDREGSSLPKELD